MKLPAIIRAWMTDVAMRMARLTKRGDHYGGLAAAVVSDMLWDEWMNIVGGTSQSRHIQTPRWCDIELAETRILEADGYQYRYYDVAVKKKVHRIHLGIHKAPG